MREPSSSFFFFASFDSLFSFRSRPRSLKSAGKLEKESSSSLSSSSPPWRQQSLRRCSLLSLGEEFRHQRRRRRRRQRCCGANQQVRVSLCSLAQQPFSTRSRDGEHCFIPLWRGKTRASGGRRTVPRERKFNREREHAAAAAAAPSLSLSLSLSLLLSVCSSRSCSI